MFEPTGSRRDAASVIFNLPGYRVIDAVDLPLGSRRVKVQPVDLADGCPACGVVSGRVHAWVVQQVRDVPYAGQVAVLVRKPRLVRAEPACPRRTFTPATPQLPVGARCATRLKKALLAAVIDAGLAVVEVAAACQVAWRTVQATVNAAAVLLPEVDELQVRRLGIDEHRYRRVRCSVMAFLNAADGSIATTSILARQAGLRWASQPQPLVRCWASSTAATPPRWH